MSATNVLALDVEHVTVAQAQESLRELAKVPIGPMLDALEQLTVNVVLPDAAAIAGALAPFFPEAKIAQIAILALILVIHGYETGAIKSADPQDPAMQRASGPDNASI